MKKIFIILSVALSAAIACNKNTFGPDLKTPVDDLPEGTKVELRFSLGEEQIKTRGEMTAEPNITKDSLLYVFVYNANSGMLLEVAKATIASSVTQNTEWGTTTEAGIHHTDFNALVSTGSAPRYMQFIVDPPTYETDGSDQSETGIGYKDSPIFLGESETNVVAKLYNTANWRTIPEEGEEGGTGEDGDEEESQGTLHYLGSQTSYWQRVYLPNGLRAYTYPGGLPAYGTAGTDWTYTPDSDSDPTNDTYVDAEKNTVYYGDYVNGNGHKITDGTGYICSAEVSALLRHIPTVRNFVNIRVSPAKNSSGEVTSNFIPSKAVLINTPAYGYIAPYSPASGFVSYYQFKDKLQYLKPIPTTDPAYDPSIKYGTEGVASTGYTAPIPKDKIMTGCPAEDECVDAVNGVIDLYMYERGVPTSNPTQLLVYGTLNGKNTWLKIDITDEDGNYIPFFREFTYEMAIGTITGVSGYGSMQAAYEGPSIGNPSSSPETATLTQVTDGKGVGIWVDFIDYASFDTKGETVRLRYKFWNATQVLSSSAVVEVSDKTSTGAITSKTLTRSPYTGVDDEGVPDTQDREDGWYYVDVPLHKQESDVLRSVLKVSGTTTNTAGKSVTLYREITFSVMPTQELQPGTVLSPLASDNYQQSTTLKLVIPDGLGYSLFPLVFRIEAYNGSLNPLDTDLPVEHGVSTFSKLKPDDDLYRATNSYWFNKTISYDDYKAGTRTFTAEFYSIYNSDNATTVLVTDAKGHFVPKTLALATGSGS